MFCQPRVAGQREVGEGLVRESFDWGYQGRCRRNERRRKEGAIYCRMVFSAGFVAGGG